MNYTFNSQFTFNNSPKLEEKKVSLLEKVLSKRDELGYSTADLTNRQVEVLDGDTLRVKASPTDLAQNPNETHFDIRLKPNDFNASYDAYENKLHTDNIDARTEAKLSKQRQAIEDNEWFKGWFNPATNEDVFERGQVTQQKLQDTINAQQGLKIKYQGLDQNNRVLADILDSRSNESITNALNTEEDNASYNTKYNEGFRKQVDSTPLESLQDAATSFGIGATVLSGQALVGTADLVQGLLKKSLGIEDTPSITDYLQEVGYDPLKTKQVLDETFHTDKFLAKQKKLQKAMTSSDDEWENAKNTAKFLLDNPEHLITGTVMESLPMMLQGGLLAKASKNPLLVGAITEGTQSAAQIADTADIQGRTQEQYVIPAIAAGIGTGAINLGMNSLAGDALISAITKGQAGKTTLTKALFGEATEEALQTAQEQVFTNIAEGEEDIFKGIGSNTVLGAAAGAATGGPIQAVHSTANTLSNALKPKEIQTPAQEDTVQSEQSSNDLGGISNTVLEEDDNVADYTSAIKPKSFGIQDETFTQYGIDNEEVKQNVRNEFNEMDSLLKDSKQVENIKLNTYDDSSKEELLKKLNTVNFGNLSPEAEKNLSIISDKFRNDYNNSTELTDPFIKNELNIDSSNLDPEATEIARKVAKGELDSNFDLPALTQAISKNIEPEAKPDNISLMEHLLTNVVKNEPSKLNDTSFQSKLISGLNTLQSIKQGTIPKVNKNTTPEEFKFILENNLGSLNWTKEQRTEIDNGIKILQEQIKKEPSNEELKKILNNYKRYEGFISALENTKDIDTVSSEVLNGSTTEDGQRKPSANQWLQLITLKSNDKNTTDKLLGQLTNWSKYHSKKSTLLSQISSVLESRVDELPETLIEESRDTNTELGKLFTKLEQVQKDGGAFSTKVNAKQYQLIGDAEDGKHLYNAFDKLARQVNFEANYLENTIKLAKGIINPELVSESSTIDSKPQNQESSIDVSTEETKTESKIEEPKEESWNLFTSKGEEFDLVNSKDKTNVYTLLPTKLDERHPLSNKPLHNLFTLGKPKLIHTTKDLLKNLLNLVNIENSLESFESIKKFQFFTQEFISKWKSSFDLRTPKGFARYVEDNPSVALLLKQDKSKDNPENILTAISLASLNWLNSSKITAHNDQTAVNQIFGWDDNAEEDSEIYTFMSQMGSIRSVMANQLGKAISKSLGLKPSKDIDQDLIAKFELSLGLEAIDILEKLGLVEYKAIPKRIFNLMKNGKPDKEIPPYLPEEAKPLTANTEEEKKNLYKESVVFVKVKTELNKKGKLDIAENVSNILKDTKEALPILNKLLGTEYFESKPTNKPLTQQEFNERFNATTNEYNDYEFETNETWDRSNTEYSSEDLKALFNYQQVGWKVNTPALDLFNKLTDDTQERIYTGRDKDSLVQQHFKESVEGKELSWKLDKQSLDEAIEIGNEREGKVYFQSSIWKQGRVGMKGGPQNNKMMRWLFAPESWNLTINPSKDKELFRSFQLAVIAAFGGKPENINFKAQEGQDLLSEFTEIYLNNESLQTVLEDLSINGKITNEQALIKAIDEGGEGFHTLAGILALASYMKSIEEGKESFETNIGFESDGKTNGVIIGLMMLSGITDYNNPDQQNLLNAGGLYPVNQSYSEWIHSVPDVIQKDNYQKLSTIIEERKRLQNFYNQYALENKQKLEAYFQPKFLEEAQDKAKEKDSEKFLIPNLVENYIFNNLLFKKKLFPKKTDSTEEKERKRNINKEILTKFDEENPDVRNALMSYVGKRLNPNYQEKALDKLEAVDNIVGEINRNFSKYPLMITVFGSSINKVVKAIANDVINSLYETIEKVSNILNNDPLKENQETRDAISELQHIEENLSLILGTESTLNKVLKNISSNKLQNFKFDNDQLNLIKSNIEEKFKPIMNKAINQGYGEFIANRKEINNAFALMNEMFEQIRIARIKEIEAEKRQGISRTEFNELMEELRPLQPAVDTPTSNGNLKQKLQLWSKSTSSASENKMRVQVENTPEGHRTIQYYYQLDGEQQSVGVDIGSISGNAEKFILEEIGVRPAIMSIHNMDSYPIKDMMKSIYEFLGVHDAIITGLKDIKDTNIKMNKELYERIANFDLFGAVYDSIYQASKFIAQNKYTLDKSKLEKYLKISNQEFDSVKKYLQAFKEFAENKEQQKQEQILDNITSFSNYGGIYPYIIKEEKEILHIDTAVKEAVESENKTATESNQESTTNPANKEIEDIYNQLGNKTKSTNIIIISWNNLKEANKAITTNGIVATRIHNSNEHFGNPFSHNPTGKTQGLIKTETIKEAVERYIDWVINSNDTRANWIRTKIQSGVLKNKPILYYKELGEPSHATALDYLINKYTWNNTQQDKFNGELDSLYKELEYTPEEDYDESINDFLRNNPEFSYSEVREAVNNKFNLGSTPGVSSTNPFIGDNSILTSENVEASLEKLFTEDRNIVDSEKHQNYLRDTIKDLIAKVMKPIEYYQTKAGDTTYGFIDPTFSKVAVNIAQTVNQNYSGIKMSAATTYVHELIHAVTGIALTSPEHFNLYRETVRLFNHVKSNLTSEQIERYAYVFKNGQTVRQTYTNTKGIQQEHIYNQGILEFIAYAKTEPELMKLIEVIPDMKDIRLQDMPLNQAISSIFNRIIDWFNRTILNKDLSTRGRIDAITLALSTAHIKRKPSLLGKLVIPDTWNKYVIEKAKDLIAKPLLDLNQKINNKSSNRNIKNTTNTIANLVNADWKNINASFREGVRKLGVIDNNIASSITSEIAGSTEDMKKFHKQIAVRQVLRDHFVNKAIETVSKILSDAFTKKLTKEVSETITKVGIKGDISYLSKIYSDEDLIKLLSDETFRQEEISNLQDKLIANPYRQYFINQVRNLGSFMINNTFLKEEHINAHNVDLIINNVSLIDEHYKPEENLRNTLKQLSRLYAIEFMQQSDKESFVKLLNEEKEGIATTLKGHDNYKKNYLNKILKGNKLLVVDGAIKESYNPNRSLVIANNKEGKGLVKQGYYKNPIKLKRSGIDNSDSDMYLWFADVKMLQTYQQAGTAFTELNDSLSNFMEGYTASDSTKQIMSKLSKNAVPRNALKDAIRLSNSRTNRNSPEEQNSLTPKYNQDGRIIGFTYTLHESIKDEYLDRVMKHDYVMASMNASIIDQLATKPINEKMIDTLIQDQKEFVRYPKLFVQIGPDSPNKEYRDIWFRLPKQTKEMVKEKTGFDYLMVREEALDYVFGYRKVSAANWIRPYTVEELANHKHIKQLGNWVFDHLNPNNKFMNMHNLRKVESGIQEAVKMAKDTIVIKLPKTLIANELSNTVTLHTRGIPADFIIKEKAEALTNAKLYFKTTKEISELKYLMDIDSKYNTKENQFKVVQLETLQTQNPVHQLVKEGVFQTIVEDIAANEGLWNWKSRYEDKLEKLGEKVPKIVKETGKFIAMTHDTKMYKFLHDTTQVSDLTARYVLHKWNLQQGMKLEESLDDIVSTFVNYELPTHRFIEYGNEMGVFMFTKYFFRILKPMVKETLRHPLNVAALHMLQMFYMFESVHNIEFTDVFNKINDPFSTIFSIIDANPFYQATT